MPMSPSSRPYPEFLMPPNGSSASDQSMLLMNIMPVSTWLATRLPRAMLLVKTEPPNPKSESLASAMAASSSLTRKNSATGPKNSSLNAGFSGWMSVKIVGSMYDPGRSIRLPPMTTLAPLAIAPSTCFKRSSKADSVDNGPSVVFSSIGSPALSAARAAWNSARNLSATLSTTMNRLAAQQVCPVLYIRPQTAHLTACSRSASSRTMNASLPPSSIEDTLRFCPALDAMLLPAATLPVSATPLIRGSSTTRSD